MQDLHVWLQHVHCSDRTHCNGSEKQARDRQTDRQRKRQADRVKESINHSIDEWLLFVHGLSINSNNCFNGMNLWAFLYLYRMKIICIYNAFSASSILVTKYVKVSTHLFFLNFFCKVQWTMKSKSQIKRNKQIYKLISVLPPYTLQQTSELHPHLRGRNHNQPTCLHT